MNAQQRPFSGRRRYRPAVAAALGAVLILAAPGPARALESGEFNPALWDSLLSTYVSGTGVHYQEWKAAGTADLDRFLADAGAWDLDSVMGKELKASFLINAYNAWAVRQVLEHYPVKSVQDIPGFFDKNAVLIAGKKRTLNEMEADLAAVIPHRPQFLFALAPGAVGMPRLDRRPYTSEDFTNRLKDAGGVYLTPERLHYDQKDNTLHLPPPFRDHMELFDAQPRGLVGVLAVYMPLNDVIAVNSMQPKRVFDPADWSLNDAKPLSEMKSKP